VSVPDQQTACQRAAEEAIAGTITDEYDVIVGVYVPECDEQGNYRPLQHHGSTGYSWCVDEHGREIPGTNTPPGKPHPDCSEYSGGQSQYLSRIIGRQSEGSLIRGFDNPRV